MTMRIVAETYHGNRRRETMPDFEAEQFKKAVKKAFEKILTFNIGVELGREINGADSDLLVIKAGPGQANKCVMERQSAQDMNLACYTEVLATARLSQKIQELIDAKVITAAHPAVAKFLKFYVTQAKGGKKEQFTKTMGTGSRAGDYPIAHQSPTAERQAAHGTDRILRNRIGEFDSLKKIEEGVDFVRSLQNGLIGYHIMSHLTPGAGTGAFVVWDPDQADAGADLPPSERAPWMTRPSWVALVHELIHGWRLVTGRCVFRPEPLIEEYYEEAMTVGLPPYDGCKFTENRFRQAGGEALRTFYGQKTKIISEAAQRKHKSVAERLV